MVVERVAIVRRIFEAASLRRPEQKLSQCHRLCSSLDRRLLTLRRLLVRLVRLVVRPVVRVVLRIRRTQAPPAEFLLRKGRVSSAADRRRGQRTGLASLRFRRRPGAFRANLAHVGPSAPRYPHG